MNVVRWSKLFKKVVAISASLLYLSELTCAKRIHSNGSKVSVVKNRNGGNGIKSGNAKASNISDQHSVRGKSKKLRGKVLEDVKNLKSSNNEERKTQKMGGSLFGYVTREKVKNVLNRVSNGLVDSFADKPLLSTLKYVVAPLLPIKLTSVVINEIYNYRHFPSKMKTEYLMYLLENNCNKCPTKEELKKYISEKFSNGVYNGSWDIKKRMIDCLVEILMTNYLISPSGKVADQWGYGVIDTFLFRNARDRVKIASKRFLNNKGGSCFSIACYLLMFMEKLGIEARLAFCHFPNMPIGMPQSCHACLVYKENATWKRMDLPLRFAIEADDQVLDKKYIGKHLLVLEEIKKDDKRKFTEMKCAVIGASDKSIDEIDIDNLEYKYKVPFLFNW